MAIIENNLFLFGASGMVGEQMVFRNRKGKIILSKRPHRTKEYTDMQVGQMLRFKEASIYAKAALMDEGVRKAYDEKAQHSEEALSAYNVAIADYLRAPVVRKVVTDGYNGGVGDVIVVSATDDFEVKEVLVEIRQSDDTLVEKGMASAGTNGLDWVYTTQSVNNSPAGSVVTVRVSDRPGNVTEKEVVI